MANPVLVIRLEVFCLILVVIIRIFSLAYRSNNYDKLFHTILWATLAHLVLNIASSTIVLVPGFNDPGTTLYIVTRVIYYLFYLSIVFYCSLFLKYALMLTRHRKNMKFVNIASYFAAFICLILLFFTKITFERVNDTYISSGVPPVACFAVAFFNFICAFGVMIIYRKQIKENVMKILFPISFTAIFLIFLQSFISELMITGASITLVTIGFFFSSEDTTFAFKQENRKGGIGEIKKNSDFNDDLVKYNEEFISNKQNKFIIARVSIDNLLEINSVTGHPSGSQCIEMVMRNAVDSLINCEALYRSSGVEITAIYKNKNEDIVKNDLFTLKTSLKINSANLEISPVISLGYAVSSETNNNLDEVLNASNFSLYKNRKEPKTGEELLDVNGISINITGLSDYMFDAMCLSNDTDHPYLLNLKTNVMRIAPKWKEEFGLANDIMYDLPTVWINHIHPDDRQNFIDNFTNSVSGKQKEHHLKYRSLNKDGVYVKCYGHGSLYANENGLQLFAGHMETFGIIEDENDDSWVK